VKGGNVDIPQPVAKGLKIRMELPFSEFGEDRRRRFVSDLATITGCPTDQITNIRFSPGCVIFVGDLDAAAVERLLDLYKGRANADDSQELRALNAFLEEYSVSKVTDDFEIRVQIRTSKKSGDAKPVAVLVHGWNGDSATFGAMPEYLRASVDCDVKVYPFSSSWWKHSPSILFVARNLDNWIRNNAAGCELAFVAHSLGGLVVRRLMIMQDEVTAGFERQVRNITFIASPHNGATLASIGRHVPVLKSAQLDELSPGSSVLFDLNAQWDKWLQRNVSGRCTVRNIFGTADKVVSNNEGRGLDPEAVPILGAGHIDIVKPAKEDDEVVLTVARFLREAGFPSAAHVER